MAVLVHLPLWEFHFPPIVLFQAHVFSENYGRGLHVLVKEGRASLSLAPRLMNLFEGMKEQDLEFFQS